MPRVLLLAILPALLAAPVIGQDAADGAALFNENCAACHQPGGVGEPGLAPPLVDAALWQGLGDAAPAYLGGVMLGGLSGTIEAGGQSYFGLVMPPQDWLSDAELAAIGDYVLAELNGRPAGLEEAELAAIRGAVPSHKALRDLRKTALP